jgi:hypothetical protein
MEFKSASNGGNCNGCSWISAMGEITEETPKKLEEYLKKSTYIDRIIFHSSGGNLLAGLKMGRILRKYNIKVGIGKTVEDTSVSSTYKYDTVENGYCYSSCAYAFLGGVDRVVDNKDKLGFHQFYDSKAINNLSQKQFNAHDMVMDQKITGYIVQYLEDMGIDIRLYSLISKTHPLNMYNLSNDELDKYGINTNNLPTTDWILMAYDKGLVAEIKSKENKFRTARLYATRKNKYFFTVFVPSDYFNNSTYPLYSSINKTFSRYRNLVFLRDRKMYEEDKAYKVLNFTSYLSKNGKKISLVFEINRKTAKELAVSNYISLSILKTNENSTFPYPPRADYSIFDLISFGKISGDKRLPLIGLKNKI